MLHIHNVYLKNVFHIWVLHIHNIQRCTFTMCICSMCFSFTTCITQDLEHYECALTGETPIMSSLRDWYSRNIRVYMVNVSKHIRNMLLCTLWTCFWVIICTFTTSKVAHSQYAFLYVAYSLCALPAILYITNVIWQWKAHSEITVKLN